MKLRHNVRYVYNKVIHLKDIVTKKHGFSDVVLMPDLQDIIKKTEKFASFLAEVSPELCKLITNNETLNNSLHKKYLKYIEQRLK